MTNFADAFYQGQENGARTRERREASYLQDMMGEAYTAPEDQREAALTEVGRRSPQAAMQLEDAFANQGKRRAGELQNRAKLLLALPEAQRPVLWQRMRGDIAKLYPELAEAATMEYDDATFLPVLQQLASPQGGATPAEIQVFEARAKAAGLTPGSPEYQEAAQIALGLRGRASSAGMSFDTVDDNGVPRPQRRDPRSGQVEMYVAEQGQWIPLGGGAGVGATVRQGAPQRAVPQALAVADAQGQTDDEFANLPAAVRMRAAELEAAGQPFHIAGGRLVEGTSAGVLSEPASVGGDISRTPINEYGGGAVNAAPPPGRGRTKEDEAAAIEAAKLRTQLAFAPEQAQADAAREGRMTDARETAEREQQAIATLPQVEVKANATIQLIEQALNHPGRRTATGLSGATDPRNYLRGTHAKDFQVLLDQLKGQTFLEAFQMLKGGGAITQVEGVKAEQAIARLNTAQSDEAFVEALQDLREVANSALRGARQRAEQAQGGAAPAQVPMPGRAGDVVDNSNPLANYGF